ncbi:MAG: 4-pyridoxate dehydrogenase [Alphaproteobacteria bacterium]|nr:4-pyridoxate dehydrogenase [Alphaproteobacteria bacterium]
MSKHETCDYVIVGAGSAGCTLANRLTEDRDVRVVLLEAGRWDRSPWLHIPLAWGRNVLRRSHDWMYSTEPSATMAGRRIPIYRGRVIGGSSSINAMAYVRGHRGDYDRWADHGLPDWSYAHVLPYFRRAETWAKGADDYRGDSGPLGVSSPHFPDPLLDAFLEAGSAAGHPTTADYNGLQQEGFSRGQSTIRDGRRCSAAVAYLRPALDRPNLRVETQAVATQVLLEGGRAVGIRYRQNDAMREMRAEREVILSGGAINSPQLLMLSGVGDPAELKAHGIAVKAALKGVGQNLQDHISAGVDCLRKEQGPLHRALRLDRIVPELARAHFFGTGLAASLPNNVMAFLKSDVSANMPDKQLLFRVAPMDAGPYLAPFKPAYPDGFGCRPTPLRPESRGAIRLASSDPFNAPRIEIDFLATDQDLRMVRSGIRMAREIFNQSAVRAYTSVEIAPGPDKTSDTDLDAYARATATTVYHPLGTCKMGPESDDGAVVDPQLRVRGVDQLRVVDASVMPDLVGGNINAPVIMIAERAADLIRDQRPLAPVAV